MSDVEKITHTNQARRRWADDIAEQNARNRERMQKLRAAQKRRDAKRKAVRVLYVITGACAAGTGFFAAVGLTFQTVWAWSSVAVAVGIGLVSLLYAIAWDKGN